MKGKFFDLLYLNSHNFQTIILYHQRILYLDGEWRVPEKIPDMVSTRNLSQLNSSYSFSKWQVPRKPIFGNLLSNILQHSCLFGGLHIIISFLFFILRDKKIPEIFNKK